MSMKTRPREETTFLSSWLTTKLTAPSECASPDASRDLCCPMASLSEVSVHKERISSIPVNSSTRLHIARPKTTPKLAAAVVVSALFWFFVASFFSCLCLLFAGFGTSTSSNRRRLSGSPRQAFGHLLKLVAGCSNPRHSCPDATSARAACMPVGSQMFRHSCPP